VTSGRGWASQGRSIRDVATVLDTVAADASGCTRCGLAAGRTQVVFGNGHPEADCMIVGEGPGADEDAQGLPFVGRSGQLLDRLLLEEMGVTRAEVYVANVVKCRPPGNRDPRPDEVEACAPWLSTQLELVDPRVVVTLGNFATRALLGTRDGITKLRGHTYPWRGRTLVPTFHPAAVLRGGSDPMMKMRADLVRAKQVLTEPTGAAP
jgi:uracil-DNA glycosylase